MDENEQKQQFLKWLPFYVNARLDENEREWMTQYLAQHPKAELDLQIERALKAAMLAELPETAADEGLAAFMGRVRAESGLAKPIIKESWRQLAQQCLDAWVPVLANPRWAVAIALLFFQTGLIGMLSIQRQTPTQSEWRSVAETQQLQGPVLQVTFKPSATEEEIRLLLIKIRGSFLGGPGQLGNYLIKVPKDGIVQAKNLLMNTAIVESVVVLDSLPVHP
jgi:hypothetical protein